MTQNQVLRVCVTISALVLVVLHLWEPDLEIDSITVVLLIVAVLPWAQPLIKSIELLGVKLELQELRSELADAKGAAESAVRKSDYLLSSVAPAPSAQDATTGTINTSNKEFARLIEAYQHIRDTQSSGTARTQAMTAVVRKMIELTPAVREFAVGQALMSKQRGQRLAAYAYLYAQPDTRFLEPLVISVTRVEDKPFGQYWGLQAIARALGRREYSPVPYSVFQNLRQYAERVPSGTDRDYEIRKILRDLDVNKKASD